MTELPAAAMGRARSAAVLSGSAATAAALGWVTLVAVGRLEGESVYGTVAVIWAAYYGTAGILSGLQHEITRTSVEVSSGPTDPRGLPLMLASLLVGAAGVVLLMASFPFWLSSLDLGLAAAVGLAIGVAGLTGQVVVLGLLAARSNWRVLAALLLTDAAVRLLGVVLVAQSSGGSAAYAATIGGASWVWVPLVLSRTGSQLRSDLALRITLRAFLPRAGAAMLATGCASLIVAGLPWLMVMASRPVTAETAGLLAALVLFRSPVLAITNSLRPLVMRELLSGTATANAGITRLWLWCAAGGAVLSVAAFFLGPRCLTIAFGDGFDVTRIQAAGLVVSAALLAMATVATIGLMAIDAHARAAQCWILALAVTIVVLTMAGGGSDVVVVAAIAGPLSAVVWIAFRGLGVPRGATS